MMRRPANKSGYINLPTVKFEHMVSKIKNEEDIKVLQYAHVNYIGHRNLLKHSYIDKFMLKALEVGHPEMMIETFKYHREFLYHPNPKVTQKYFECFAVQGYEKLKAFYMAVKHNYLLILPEAFYGTVIDQAFENKEYPVVIDAYLQCMNYKALALEHFIKVYESQNFDMMIDHGLYKHLESKCIQYGFNHNSRIKLNQTVYALKNKNYSEAADLLI